MNRAVLPVLGLSLLMIQPGDAAAQAAVPRDSLRIATFNAYLLSPLFKCLGVEALAVVPAADCIAQIEGETEGWAENLAKTILNDSDNIDVIAINEAWDEDAKRILRNRLRRVYPIQITDIDKDLVDIRADLLAGIPPEFAVEGTGRISGEDSGLMLFAKPDFRVLPLPNATFKWGNDEGETLRSTSPEVAFAFYEACGAEDCYAAKGAGLVRLQHRSEGPVYNLVFTHMQADYPPETHIGARTKQFEAVQRLIEKTLDPVNQHIQANEVTVLLGDLNVPYLLTRDEWNDRFDTGQSFFRQPLYESAHFTSSLDDRTPTNDTDVERLDYILASPKPATNSDFSGRQRCVQHVTVPVNFRELESDHNMVRSDINRSFFHCSPSIAFPVELDGQGSAVIDRAPNTTTDVTQIKTAGAMQWFEIRNDGTATYSIGTDTNEVVADIFLPNDMTTPFSRVNETPATVTPGLRRSFALDQYVINGRFFIRLAGRTRNTVSNYALAVRRHDCSSKAAACILRPGSLQEAKLSSNVLEPGQLAFQDEAWFRFDAVGKAESGAPQTITLTASLHQEPRVASRIEDFSDPLGGTLTESAMTNIRGYTGAVGDGTRGYLVIKQSSRGAAATPVKAALDTNLRFIKLGHLTCWDETNPEVGSDDIYTRVTFDGVKKRAPASDYVEFDCNNNHDQSAWWPKIGGSRTKAFFGQFAMQVFEEDDVSADDDARREEAPPLANGAESRDGQLRWLFDDGEYRFDYQLRRFPNEPIPDP